MAYTSDRTSPFNFSPRLVVGGGLVVFGILLLLGGLDILNVDAVLRLWPLILIAIGLQQFFNPRVGPAGERVFPVNGVIWMAIGGILLLNTTGMLRANIWDLFWPAILIAIGVRLMTRSGPRIRVRHRRHRNGFTAEATMGGAAAPPADATTASSTTESDPTSPGWSASAPPPPPPPPPPSGGASAGAFVGGDAANDSADTGAIFAVLSGVKRVSAAVPFYGTEVTAFMGGAHIDLRRAILAPGEEAVIDMFVVIGGCELVIPSHWVVSAPLVAVMGGVDDKRLVPLPSVVEDATARAATPPRLVIRGFVMMGGVTIRS